MEEVQQALVEQFKETGNECLIYKGAGRLPTDVTTVDRVHEAFQHSPGKSILHIRRELQTLQTTMKKILSFNMICIKVPTVQAMEPDDLLHQ